MTGTGYSRASDTETHQLTERAAWRESGQTTGGWWVVQECEGERKGSRRVEERRSTRGTEKPNTKGPATETNSEG